MPKLDPADTAWGRFLTSSVRSPAALRAAMRNTLVRAQTVARGAQPKPLLVLVIGPPASGRTALLSVVRRLATSVALQQHLTALDDSRELPGGVPAWQASGVYRPVTWCVMPATADLEEREAIVGGVEQACGDSTDLMCVTTRQVVEPLPQIASAISVLDVLLWMWSPQRKPARRPKEKRS